MLESTKAAPKAFISYAWEEPQHQAWVRILAERLRHDGVDVTLDQWHLAPGDQLSSFMEQAVRENDFVLIICTPRYKEKSDARTGGVGYEGDIMTAEVLTTQNHRKFIPILRKDEWRTAAPSWLMGKFYIDFRGTADGEEHYHDLLTTLHGRRRQPPPIGPLPERFTRQEPPAALRPSQDHIADVTQPIKIKGVIVDEVSSPSNDGTRGSALYRIPFQLSHRPSPEWAQLFIETWNHPPQFTTMHRPGIARVVNDRVVLDGTTMEEIERYHRDTLKLVVERVNELVAEREKVRKVRAEEEQQNMHRHQETVQEIAERLKFN